MDNHHHNHAHDHHNPTLETKGRTISWASFYDAAVWLLSLGRGRAIRQATVEPAQIKPGDRVLDVGCGTGDLTMAAKAVAGPGGEVVGTDASPQMIDLARRKAARVGVEVTFQLDLIEAMTFPDNQFDVVLSSLMMHHLPDDLKREGLAEIYRVLKPGGRLLIVDMESSSSGSPVQRLSDVMIQLHGGHTAMQNNVKKLIPLVEAAGFISVETAKINRQLSYIAGKKAPVS
jgi:demethylmenaquinone methyltransferase/2-methoxy-6-polyprenyl-1,4-benzoquinol methylase/phosphoethanolamine N-methyltransferase